MSRVFTGSGGCEEVSRVYTGSGGPEDVIHVYTGSWDLRRVTHVYTGSVEPQRGDSRLHWVQVEQNEPSCLSTLDSGSGEEHPPRPRGFRML